MGDSKRRKKFDPNYGETKQMQPQMINYCNSVLAQESAFIALDFWSDGKKVGIAAIDINKLEGELVSAYNLARQKTIMDLAIHRQYKQSLGCLNLMARQFKEKLLGKNEKENGHIIFNWLKDADIEQEYRLSRTDKTKKTSVLEVVNYLTKNCNPAHQFPTWFSGIPSPWDKNILVDLIFVCDRANPSDQPIKIVNTSTNYL